MKRQDALNEFATDIYNTGVAIDGTDLAYGTTGCDSHFHRMAARLMEKGYCKTEHIAEWIAKELSNHCYQLSDKPEKYSFKVVDIESIKKILDSLKKGNIKY